MVGFSINLAILLLFSLAVTTGIYVTTARSSPPASAGAPPGGSGPACGKARAGSPPTSKSAYDRGCRPGPGPVWCGRVDGVQLHADARRRWLAYSGLFRENGQPVVQDATLQDSPVLYTRMRRESSILPM